MYRVKTKGQHKAYGEPFLYLRASTWTLEWVWCGLSNSADKHKVARRVFLKDTGKWETSRCWPNILVKQPLTSHPHSHAAEYTLSSPYMQATYSRTHCTKKAILIKTNKVWLNVSLPGHGRLLDTSRSFINWQKSVLCMQFTLHFTACPIANFEWASTCLFFSNEVNRGTDLYYQLISP